MVNWTNVGCAPKPETLLATDIVIWAAHWDRAQFRRLIAPKAVAAAMFSEA